MIIYKETVEKWTRYLEEPPSTDEIPAFKPAIIVVQPFFYVVPLKNCWFFRLYQKLFSSEVGVLEGWVGGKLGGCFCQKTKKYKRQKKTVTDFTETRIENRKNNRWQVQDIPFLACSFGFSRFKILFSNRGKHWKALLLPFLFSVSFVILPFSYITTLSLFRSINSQDPNSLIWSYFSLIHEQFRLF